MKLPHKVLQMGGLVLAVVMFAAAPPVTPSAVDVVDLLQQRGGLVDNLVIVAVWSEFEEGRLVLVERQTVHQDKLGRIRIQSETQGNGALPRWRDALFNGEVTLSAEDDQNRSRLGEPHTEETRRRHERYRHAFVYNGLFKGMDPRSCRNPFTYGMGIVRDMAHALSAGKAVTTRRVREEAELFELRFEKQSGQEEREHILLVDGTKGWNIVSHQEYAASGKLLRQKDWEYAHDTTSGMWLPSSGRTQYWGEPKELSDPPMWEWAFRVEKIVVNDPSFDEQVFTPTLRPGTHVVDTRHDTAYWVGAEGAIDDQLTLLAQQARAEDEANFKRIEQGRAAIQASDEGWRIGPGLRFWLVTINVAVVAAVALFWWLRRRATG